jgi:hypothetical protein
MTRLLWCFFAYFLVRAEMQTTGPIKYLSYTSIVSRLRALATAAPDIVTVWSAQSKFGLASPGFCDSITPCQHWFATVTGPQSNRSLLEIPLAERPQVFFSGNLHGDEKVGPMALIYFLEHLIRHWKDGDNPWITKLVNSRVIIALPISNPLGYSHSVREENNIDPNRDFPYDNSNPRGCMQVR